MLNKIIIKLITYFMALFYVQGLFSFVWFFFKILMPPCHDMGYDYGTEVTDFVGLFNLRFYSPVNNLKVMSSMVN